VTLSLNRYSEFFGYKNNWHHIEGYKLLDDESIKRLLNLWPRRGAKTECGINFISRIIGKNPNIRIKLISKTYQQACSILRPVRWRLEHDPRQHSLFGNLADRELWTDNQFIVKRDLNLKDPTLQALGVLGPIVGGRADIIILDDVCDEQNTATENQREKLLTWYQKELLPVLEPDGRVIVNATRWHHNDLYKNLMDSGFKVNLVDCYQLDETAPDKIKSYWEADFPLLKLEEIKKEIGSIFFACQYRNNPTPLEGVLFKKEWLHEVDETPSLVSIFGGWDPAISEKQTADYTAMVKLGKDSAGNYYLFQSWIGHVNWPDARKQALDFFAGCTKVGVESVQFQAAITQDPELKHLPLVPYRPVGDKVSRLTSLSAFHEAGRIKILRGQSTDFKEEFLSFNKGAHDDLLDAEYYAFQAAGGFPSPLGVIGARHV